MQYRWVGLTAALVGGLLGPAAQAQDHDPACPGVEPLLTVADFNGDGVVSRSDLRLMRKALRYGEYLAFFDRNADGALTRADARLAARDFRKRSTELDQEIAAVFWATVRLRDVSVAVAEGWIPVTQEFVGHGIHAANFTDGRADLTFEPTRPEGLNYTADGELVAVYYFHGPHYSNDDPPPEGFSGDEDQWHHHAGVCLGGVDPLAPTYDPTELNYTQCVMPQECFTSTGSTSTIWIPKFHMLHLWLYKLNPCGKFAMTHPDVGLTGEPGPDTMCDVEDVLP